MNQDVQDKSLDDVLRLMENADYCSDKPWDALKDAENREYCRELMDIRLALYKQKAEEECDVEAALDRFKKKQSNRKYTQLFIAWVSSVAALLIGFVFSFNYIFHTSGMGDEVLAFQADTTSQQIVLSTDEGDQVVLDAAAELQQPLKVEKKRALDYTANVAASVPVVRKMLQTHKIVIPRGKTFKLVLSDSTEVWLNADSKLVYPTEFVEKERSVFLQGEAYFKVAKHAKPFVVKTDYLQTRVLGTEFNVRTYSPEDVHVTLVKGKVRVSSLDNFSSVELDPGKDVTLGSKGEFALSEVNSDIYTYWKDGYFYFDQLPLLDIMKSIGKWYNLNVVFRNQEAMKIRMFFMADRNDGVEETIRLMNRLKRITLTLHNGTLYVD